jgi:hypothetical protein
MGWLESRTSPVIGRATLGTVLVGLCLWGLLQTGSYAYSGTILADRADLNAIEWVREHTPLDARFLINAQPWQTASYRGVDGGYWLLTLTGRQTELPPAMYGYGDHTLIQTVNDRAQAASQLKDCTDDFWRLVKEAQLTYIYIKQGVGALQPENLSNCQNILPVYRKDGIYIFQITGE